MSEQIKILPGLLLDFLDAFFVVKPVCFTKTHIHMNHHRHLVIFKCFTFHFLNINIIINSEYKCENVIIKIHNFPDSLRVHSRSDAMITNYCVQHFQRCMFVVVLPILKFC